MMAKASEQPPPLAAKNHDDKGKGKMAEETVMPSEAMALMKEGRWEEAIEVFSSVLEEQVPRLGPMAPQLAPVYLSYGRCLLQQAMEKATPFDDQLLEQQEGKEKEKDEAELEEEGLLGKKVIQIGHELSDEEDNGEEEEEPGEEGGEAGEQANEEKTTDDLEVAWEVLDLARLIYEQMPNCPAGLLADIRLDLGDVAMEGEAFDQAIQDYDLAIALLRQQEEATALNQTRALAAAWFKKAMASEYANRLAEAVEPLQQAVSLIREKINQAEAEVDPEEREDLMALLPEMVVKLEDLQGLLAKEAKIIEHGGEEESGFKGTAAEEGGPVNDLTGLVKKRKLA